MVVVAVFTFLSLCLLALADFKTIGEVQEYHRIGGQGGTEVQYHQVSESAVVTNIDAWADGDSIRGVRFTFSNGIKKTMGTEGEGKHHLLKMNYADGELVTDITIWGDGAGKRCGAFRIHTNKDQDFFPKMDRDLETPYTMDEGSGVILGGFGTHGKDVDSLGILMLRNVVGTDMVDVDYELGEASDPQLKYALDTELDNASGTDSEKGFHKFTQSEVNSGSWSVTTGFTFGQSYKVSGGVPMVAGGEATTNWQVSVSGTYGEEWSETETSETSIAFIVPSFRRIRLTVEYYQGKLDKLPFTAEMKFFLDNGKEFSTAVTGVYDGVSTSKFDQKTEVLATYDDENHEWIPVSKMSSAQKLQVKKEATSLALPSLKK